MMTSSRRIYKEFGDIQSADLPYFKNVEEMNILRWQGVIVPSSYPYSTGTFRVEINFPTEYPFKPPKVHFKTKIYHPNIGEDGQVCLPLLSRENWTPCTTIEMVMAAVVAIVNSPDPQDALRQELADEFVKDRDKFLKIAEEFTIEHSVRNIQSYSQHLRQEYEKIQLENLPYFTNVREMNILRWQGVIVPSCHPYNKGAFRVEINFPPEYPFKPPNVNFKTKIYHPNISEDGHIRLPMLSPENWTPFTPIDIVIAALVAIVNSPQPEDAIRPELAHEFTNDREKFLRIAEEFTIRHSEWRHVVNNGS